MTIKLLATFTTMKGYEAECLEDALEKVTEDFDSRKTTFDADNFELCVIEEYKEDWEWAKVKLMRNL